MSAFKKILVVKGISVVIIIVVLFVIIISVVSAITGVTIGYETIYKQNAEIQNSSVVINNQLYAERYRDLLNKYLIDKGYVTLERLVFYLQRVKNILDVTTLSDIEWENAYLFNLNQDSKQMIPIKTICKKLKEDISLSSFSVESGLNHEGVYITVIDLCSNDGIDISISDEYSENYSYLPFLFPLKSNFIITSFVFENRNVNLDLDKEEQDRINYHSGWDFSVPIGTEFYSICNGTISNVVNTQFNDLPYNQSNNSVGNFIEIICDNNLTAQYYHIQANSVPFLYTKIGTIVKAGDMIGRTSTTGLSTGPHLHLGLKREDGTQLDALQYIDFNYKK